MFAAEADCAEVAHTVNGDHFSCDLRCAHNIVGRAAGNIAEDDFFSRSAAEKHCDFFNKLLFVFAVFIFNRRIERIAEGSAAGND